MTFEDLQIHVKELLSIPDTAAATEVPSASFNTQIKRAINSAAKEWFGKLATWRPDIKDARTTLSYTADAQAVALPAAVQSRPILLVQAANAGASDALERYDLEIKSTAEFDEYDIYGEPIVWALEGTSIAVRPIPRTATTLYFRYVAELADMTATSDTPSWLPAEYHHGLAWEAAAKLKIKRGDPDAMGVKAEAASIKEDALSFLYRIYRSNAHIHSTDRFA